MSAIRFRSVILLFALFLLSGFGPRAQAADEVATVEGEVKLDGKAPSGGRIFFHQDDGQFVGAKIDKNGKFKVDRVLVGKHRVTLEFKGVPAKYTSEETSALQVAVTNGMNAFNFELASN